MTRKEELPLAGCVNGCDDPPKPPSKVLCIQCLKKLDDKWETLAARLIERTLCPYCGQVQDMPFESGRSRCQWVNCPGDEP